MSYYSTMIPGTFKSSLTLEQINQKFIEFINSQKESRRYLDFYCFEAIAGDEFSVTTKDGDYYAKHYGGRLLAEFISTVIEEGYHTTIEFDTEECGRGGYLIMKGAVKDIQYTQTVDGVILDEFLNSQKTGLTKKLIAYHCGICGRTFYIEDGSRDEMVDIDFGCPYGCDNAGVKTGTGEVKDHWKGKCSNT